MMKMKDSGYSYIGIIPTNWEVTRNKNVFSCNKVLVGSNSNSTQLLSLTTKGVKEKDINNPEGKLPESFDTYQYVKENDIVMCLFDLDVSAVFSGISPYNGMISPAYRVLTCRNNIVPQFADYWFKYISDGRKFNHYAKNIRYTLNYEDFSSLPIVFPPLETQQRIADYLDEKCKKIDAIIEKQQAVIEKLKEYKLSVITEAVTRGLHQDVDQNNTYIDWLNSKPVTWHQIKMKYLIKYIESGVSVNAGQEEAKPGELGVLKTGCVSKFFFDVHENKSVNKNEENRVSCPVKANTIIVSRMNTPELVGACGYVDNSYNNIFLPDRLWQIHFNETVNVKYIWNYLRCKNVRNYISSLSTGTSSTMQNISQGQFENITVLLPPIAEQNEIVEFLDKKCTGIDASILKKQELIKKLTEYKKSLIYEVITGKKEV